MWLLICSTIGVSQLSHIKRLHYSFHINNMNAMVTNYLFFAQMAITVFVLGFSATMVAITGDTAVYLPIMTSLIGYWFPSPIHQERPTELPSLQQIITEAQTNANNTPVALSPPASPRSIRANDAFTERFTEHT